MLSASSIINNCIIYLTIKLRSCFFRIEDLHIAPVDCPACASHIYAVAKIVERVKSVNVRNFIIVGEDYLQRFSISLSNPDFFSLSP